MRGRLLLVALSIVGSSVASGCADFTVNLAVNSTAAALQRGARSLDMERDVRLVRDALPGTIKTLDSFHVAGPDNEIITELVVKARAQYAFAFLEADLEAMGATDTPERKALVARTTAMYLSAYDEAMAWLGRYDRELPAIVAADLAAIEQRLQTVDKKGAAKPLYWAGLALGSAVDLNRDDVDKVADLPKAALLLKRSRDLDPAYENHGAALALGVLYGSQTKTMGGDPERAKQYFQEVDAATGNRFLMSPVLFARSVCVVTQDRELYEKTLNAVLAAPPTIWPEQRLANEIARLRAERYLARADELF